MRIEAIFENDVPTCDSDECEPIQNQPLNVPEYLFSEIEQFVLKELTMIAQIPVDTTDDGQNILR
jgi:hypothetical protein